MNTRAYYNEATLGDFLGDVWAAKLFVFLGALAGLGAALLFLTLAIPHYRAVMIVGPVMAEGDSMAEPLAFARFETILRGPAVAAALRQRPAVMDGIAHARRWQFAASPRTEKAADVTEYLGDAVRIEPVGGTPLRRVSYDHPDPVFAVALLRDLYGATDGIIHADSRTLAGGRAAQLEKTLARTRNPEHRRALTEELMREEQKKMILTIDQPFAAQLAEAPAAGPRPYWPRVTLVVPVMVLLGMFAGFVVFSLRRRAA